MTGKCNGPSSNGISHSSNTCTHTHTQTYTAKSTPVLHMNDITVKFSGESFFFRRLGRTEGGRGGKKRHERENISQITSRFSHPPRPNYLTFHIRALSPLRKASGRLTHQSFLTKPLLLEYFSFIIKTHKLQENTSVCERILGSFSLKYM